jgi:hypothetical protein
MGKCQIYQCLLELVPRRELVPQWSFPLSECLCFLRLLSLCLVNLYSYLFAGSSSVLIADTLVKGPDKDG